MYGGRRRTTATRRKTALWSSDAPGYHERTVMLKNCGKQCFLGPNKSFPICSKGTCKVNRSGILAAYKRAREYVTIKGTRKYKRIASRAKTMLLRKK